MREQSPEFIPTSSSLLDRLKHWDDAESWQVFARTYRGLIHDTARRAGLTEAEADDVVQDTLLSVAKKMPDFHYDPALGSFKGWLLQLTRWRIKNQLKKRLPMPRAGTETATSTAQTSTVERIADPAGFDVGAVWEEEWQKALMEVAVQRVKQTASPRQYEVFYLNVVQKQPASQVARTLNLNVAQVYLAKHRITALVKREVRRLEKEMI